MNTPMARAMSKSARSRQRLGLTALVVCLAAAPGVALASAQVSGTAQSVSVDAQNSSVKEVLSALGRNFHLQLQTSANLDKPISGTYHGSLQRIVARLLEGYNFVIQTNQNGLQVTVLGTQGRSSTAVAAVARPSRGPASPSRQTAAGGAPAVHPSPAPAPQMTAQAKAAPKSAPKSKSVSSEASASKSPPPPFVFKVAEGPAPMPTPAPATTKGPMPGPATSQMPMPKPSSAMPSVSPPTATSSGVLPVPTTSKPFPGFGGPQNPSVANGSSPKVAPPMPTPNGSSPTGASPTPTSPTPAQKP
jgi:hypothetical protein